MSERVLERDILKAVMDYLAARGIFALRMNAGDNFGYHKGKKWRKRGQAPGTADVLALLNLADQRGYPVSLWQFLPLWIEVKRPGSAQTALQKSFQADVERRGMAYIVAESSEDVEKWLQGK